MSASGNYTGGSVNRTGFGVGSTMARVKLHLKPSIQTISVKVYVRNDLGSAESDAYNFTLRDIGVYGGTAPPTHHPLENTWRILKAAMFAFAILRPLTVSQKFVADMRVNPKPFLGQRISLFEGNTYTLQLTVMN